MKPLVMLVENMTSYSMAYPFTLLGHSFAYRGFKFDAEYSFFLLKACASCALPWKSFSTFHP